MPLSIYDSNFYTKRLNKSIFRNIILNTMKYLKIGNKAIHISFISDYMMRKINLKYRKIDKSTDVLSFPHNGPDSELIGEIFISMKYVKKNCKKNRNSLFKEATLLVIHGILHLLGYDHKTTKDARNMFDLQEKIYSKYS
tara:strand:+ start:507 stop:926 length:420 start_codon:yes stop_codon:yes gene_type:complete